MGRRTPAAKRLCHREGRLRAATSCWHICCSNIMHAMHCSGILAGVCSLASGVGRLGVGRGHCRGCNSSPVEPGRSGADIRRMVLICSSPNTERKGPLLRGSRWCSAAGTTWTRRRTAGSACRTRTGRQIDFVGRSNVRPAQMGADDDFGSPASAACESWDFCVIQMHNRYGTC